MRYFFLLPLLLSAACHKPTSRPIVQPEATAPADSISIHRVGGFPGWQDHFMITPTDVRLPSRKSLSLYDPMQYDSTLSNAAYKQVKHLREAIPLSMFSAPNPSHPDEPVIYDDVYFSVIIYTGGTGHQVDFVNFPAAAALYREQVHTAITLLTTK